MAASVCIGERFKEAAPEQAREHAHRQKETGPAGDPPLTIGRQAATGNDTVHVRMMRER
jgi:hypothetical protein